MKISDKDLIDQFFRMKGVKCFSALPDDGLMQDALMREHGEALAKYMLWAKMTLCEIIREKMKAGALL